MIAIIAIIFILLSYFILESTFNDYNDDDGDTIYCG